MMIYDIETYPNVFTFYAINDEGREWYYEISDRIDQTAELLTFLRWLWKTNQRMVGFNNVGFDYPVIHHIMRDYPNVTYQSIYAKAMEIINMDRDDPRRWQLIIPEKDRFITQVDLYLIHHFDNAAKRTSLKQLEFVMHAKNLQDLPYPPGTILTSEQIDELRKYNRNDVVETKAFKKHSEKMIGFRDKLSEKYGFDFTNFNDTKIGKQIFIKRLEEVCDIQISGTGFPAEMTDNEPEEPGYEVKPHQEVG